MSDIKVTIQKLRESIDRIERDINQLHQHLDWVQSFVEVLMEQTRILED